jgi:hypothetical protein
VALDQSHDVEENLLERLKGERKWEKGAAEDPLLEFALVHEKTYAFPSTFSVMVTAGATGHILTQKDVSREQKILTGYT